MTIPSIQSIYGAVAAGSAVLFLVVARETPPTPPGEPGQGERALMFDGLKHALRVKPFWLLLVVALVGLGIFNGVNTWIENIIRPRGFSPTDAGALGAATIAGGLIGAIVLPALSDRQHRRQRYLMVAVVGAIPGLLGLTFATSAPLLFGSGAVMGFFLVSALPIGMQYAAEVTYPTPEGTSNGLIQLFGQGAVVFVFVMEAMQTAEGSFTPSLLLAAGLLVVCAVLVTQMRDPDTNRPPAPTPALDATGT